MPNWCGNNLYIKGDRTAVADFIKRVTVAESEREKRGQKYDILGNLYPTPQELKDTVSGWSNDPEVQAEREKQYAANTAKYGSKDWYDWNNRNWGTKWGDCETVLVGEEGDEQIEFQFSSAWSPPIDGIAHISTMFPNLTFHLSYSEEGMDYFGVTTFEDGCACDVCESISELDGMKEIDWDSDDYLDVMEANHEILLNAQEKMLEEAGG